MTTSAQPNQQNLDAIRDQAARWVVQLQDAKAEQQAQLQADCERWQAADPRHRQVMMQMQQMWDVLDPKNEKQRKGTRLAGLGSLVVALVVLIQVPWGYWTADYRSSTGEVRNISLPDGSHLVLNSNSAVNIDFDGLVRKVGLVRGEVLADVAKDPSKSFSVQTEQASATALGTRYTVELDENTTLVTVQESSVAVSTAGTGESLTLQAGQSARLNSETILHIGEVSPTKPDWVNGRLVFLDTPLQEVVARLDSYRTGVIDLQGDLANKKLTFTGVLPAEDSDASLALLADSLNLELTAITPWYVRLEEKP